MMNLFVKNISDTESRQQLKTALDKIKVKYSLNELGEVIIKGRLSKKKSEEMLDVIKNSGLEIMDNKKNILIEKIQNVVIHMVDYTEKLPKSNFSDYISSKLNHDYTYLSNLFSTNKGKTIEHFIIDLKIEKVKNYLLQGKLSLTEISSRLNYSSVAHLSNQFKKITGHTPSYFKKQKSKSVEAEMAA